MVGRWRRAGALILVVAVVAGGAPLCVQTQSVDEFRALEQQVIHAHGQGKYAEALMIAEHYVAIARQRHGEVHAEVAIALLWMGDVLIAQGRYAEAESPHRQALAIREEVLGPDDLSVSTSLNNIALLYLEQGRYAEAEPLLKRSLAIKERVLGSDDSSVGTTLGNLAEVYRGQGRYGEAEPLYQRALAITEKALGADHPSVAIRLGILAFLYQDQGRYAEAEPLLRRALAISEKAFGPDHPTVALRLNNMALLYHYQGRLAEAEPLYKWALAITEKILGPDHPSVGIRLNNLGSIYSNQGRFAEAEPLLLRALAITERGLGPDHPQVANNLANLAGLYFEQRDWARAVDLWRRSTGVAVRRTQRGTDDVGQAVTGKRKDEAERKSLRFRILIKSAYRLALEAHNLAPGLGREMLQTVQWAQGSQAAASLAQMAARGAKGDAGLSRLVRERQDLAAEWQKGDSARNAALAQAPDKRDPAIEAAAIARLAAIDTRIADIDKRLVAEFPDYAALSRPEPLSVEEVQSQLHPDEALVLFLDTPEWKVTPEETFVWVVTKTGKRWVRTAFGTSALTREVAALRCGLDAALWDDEAASGRCRGLVKTTPQRDAHGNVRSEALPFDLVRANALYKALFSAMEDLIRGKHLLIVPSGPLAQLPFQVLVTEGVGPGESDTNYRNAAWLARRHTVTVLPAVSSIKALRRIARPSVATRPMLGIGNPLLDGDPASRPWEAQWAKLARDKQICAPSVVKQVASLVQKRRSVLRVTTRSGRADLDHLRSQSPLHDTADELCAVAKDLKLARDDILLGAQATETTIKNLKLADYRVVHFATHGTVAGEIEGTSEPGLILTPPKEQTELDDGYLSASEIAALKLDADWVILSACNTAAGGAQGAEALSGLARAFVYAGARALLVSHWAVDSAATVKLITHAVGATVRDKNVGRADALRRAMLSIIDQGAPQEAHPSYWAPFVVVGEGAPAP